MTTVIDAQVNAGSQIVVVSFREETTKKQALPQPVTVGFCCDQSGANSRCEPQSFVIAVAEALFHNENDVGFEKWQLRFQQLTKNGLAPFWLWNGRRRLAQETEAQWFAPDLLLCQGYFYDVMLKAVRFQSLPNDDSKDDYGFNLTEKTRKITQKLLVEFNDTHKVFAAKAGIHLGGLSATPKHRAFAVRSKRLLREFELDERGKGHWWLWPRPPQLRSFKRPFLTTFNNEPWGGGRQRAYDLMMDTVLHQRVSKSLSTHVAPAFWYEYERLTNHKNELLQFNRVHFRQYFHKYVKSFELKNETELKGLALPPSDGWRSVATAAELQLRADSEVLSPEQIETQQASGQMLRNASLNFAKAIALRKNVNSHFFWCVAVTKVTIRQLR